MGTRLFKRRKEREVSNREVFERMTKRILDHQRKTGTKTTEREARQIAERIAERHDRKNGK